MVYREPGVVRRVWPAETIAVGAPPRALPRGAFARTIGDVSPWLVMLCVAPWAYGLPAVAAAGLGPWIFIASGIALELVVVFALRGKARQLYLLRHGAVAPSELVGEGETVGGTERSVRRTGAGWKARFESYEGPLLRSRLRIGIADGPHAEVKRVGGPCDGDLCLFDPDHPKRHVFVDDLDLEARDGRLAFAHSGGFDVAWLLLLVVTASPIALVLFGAYWSTR